MLILMIFAVMHLLQIYMQQYSEKTEPELEAQPIHVKVAGRIMTGV